MEDFNTKCYVMNNEEKLFQKKILGNFVFINEEKKSKAEVQGKNVLSFTKFVLGGFVRGFLAWEFCPAGFCREVYVRGFGRGGCPDTVIYIYICFIRKVIFRNINCFSYIVKIVHKDLCDFALIRYNFILFLKYDFFSRSVDFWEKKGPIVFQNFFLSTSVFCNL